MDLLALSTRINERVRKYKRIYYRYNDDLPNLNFIKVGCNSIEEQQNNAILFVSALLIGKYSGIQTEENFRKEEIPHRSATHIAIIYQTGIDKERINEQIVKICVGKDITGDYQFIELPKIDYHFNGNNCEYFAIGNKTKRNEDLNIIWNKMIKEIQDEVNVCVFLNFDNFLLASNGYNINRERNPIYKLWFSKIADKYGILTIEFSNKATENNELVYCDLNTKQNQYIENLYTIENNDFCITYQLIENTPMPPEKGQLTKAHNLKLMHRLFFDFITQRFNTEYSVYEAIEKLNDYPYKRTRPKDDLIRAQEYGHIIIESDIKKKVGKERLKKIQCYLNPEYMPTEKQSRNFY